MPLFTKKTPATMPGPQEKAGFFGRLKSRLSKTRHAISDSVDRIFEGRSSVDEDLMEDLEELLITSDIGVSTTMDLMKRISQGASRISDAQGLKQMLKEEILSLLAVTPQASEPPTTSGRPHVIVVVGVNGVGKTTTIGKLASRKVQEGKSVLIAAADTFRAAAVEQIVIWAERAGASVVKHKKNADPAAVVYDSIEAALARGIDTVIIDTAGRLHTKVNLMEELKKIRRIVAEKIPGAPDEILLVLDATTGQNALSQAETFNQALSITGLVLTKLDGTAKGGIVVSICHTLSIPLRYVGIGEQTDDLQDFDPVQFTEALFEGPSEDAPAAP